MTTATLVVEVPVRKLVEDLICADRVMQRQGPVWGERYDELRKTIRAARLALDERLEADAALIAERASLLAQLEAARAREAGLWEALTEVQRVLAATNQEPRGPIVDTIWYTPHETLFDYIDAALSQPRQQG